MAQPDIGFIAGLDDAQLQRQLDRVQQRTGTAIESINRRLAPLRQSMSAINGLLSGFGAAAVFGRLAAVARESEQAVAKELEHRREIARIVDQTIRAQVRAGAPADYQAEIALRAPFEQQRERLQQMAADAQQTRDLRTRIAQSALAVGRGAVELVVGNPELQRVRQERIDQANAALKTLEREEAKAVERLQEQQRAAAAAAAALDLLNHQRHLAATGAAALAAEGDVFGARRAQEAIRAEREGLRIMELSKTNMPFALQQAEAEARLRRANLAAIARDEADALAQEAELRRLKQQDPTGEYGSATLGRGNTLGLTGGMAASRQSTGAGLAMETQRWHRETLRRSDKSNALLTSIDRTLNDLARRPAGAVFA